MDEIQQVPNQNPISSVPPLTTYPTPQPAPTSKTPWMLVSLIVALLGLASYFGYQNYQLKQQLVNQPPAPSPLSQATNINQSPKASPALVVDVPKDWKKYENDIYGFSLNYPPRMSEIMPTQEAYPEGYFLIGGKTKQDLLHFSMLRFTGSATELATKYQNNPSMFGNTNWGELGNKKAQRTINGLDVIRYENDVTAMAGDQEVKFTTTNIVFTNGKLGFLIHTQDNNPDELNQILSTFQTTK